VATVPTPDQTALKILEIFIYFRRRPGEALSLYSIMGVWKEQGLDHADLKPGLDYAQVLYPDVADDYEPVYSQL